MPSPTTTSTTNTLLNFLLTNEPTFTTSRLPSLYADLSLQQHTNPEGFAANASAWTSALTLLALHRRLPGESLFILHTNEEVLDKLGDRRYGRPVGLGCVIDRAMGEGKMMEKKVFEGVGEGGIYERKAWLRIPSVGEVVRWSLRQIGVLGSNSYDVDGRLRGGEVVVVTALEEVARRVGVGLKEREGMGLVGRIVGREEFEREVGRVLGVEGSVRKEDVDLLLRHLQRDRGVLSYNDSTVKLKAANAQTPEPVTQEDVAIANLKTLIASLTMQAQRLEVQITSLQAKATAAVKIKNKQSAMAALRSKSLATKQLEQRQATLQQLEDVYAQIENAASQVEIVSTLKESAGVLKGLNKRVGDVSKVEDVLDELREEMGKTGEVQQVLNEPLTDDGAIVNGEVDDEFEAMEKEEAERKEKEEAEKTRARLAELEKTEARPAPAAEKTKEKEEAAMDVDEELAKSVERLEGMNLDERMKELSKPHEVPAQ